MIIDDKKKAAIATLKDRKKTNNRLKTLFLTMSRVALKPVIFNGIIAKAFDMFWIEYIVEKLYIENWVWTWSFRKQYIGYFIIKNPSEQAFTENRNKMHKSIVSVLEWIIKEKCTEKNINYMNTLNSKMYNASFSWWLSHFADQIMEQLVKYITIFHSNINTYYLNHFEKRNWFLVLKPQSDFLRNENINKLFREFKYSAAENYYTSELLKAIKEEYKENLIAEYEKHFEKFNNDIDTALYKIIEWN